MTVLIAPQLTQRTHQWSNWKAIRALKSLATQFDDDGIVYTIWGYDGPEVHLCTIWKGEVPYGVVGGGYTQEQNDSDKSDFESNFKSQANGSLDRRASDGRVVIRNTMASGANARYQLRILSFYTSDPTSLKNIKGVDWSSYSDATCRCYNAAGEELSGDFSTAVKTVVEFEPAFGYEIIGGAVDIPTALRDGTTNAWWAWCVALPDIPPQYGGSFEYVQPANLEAVMTFELESDGRATSYMPYTVVNGVNQHTNKLQFSFKHPAGGSQRFQVYLEIFP